MRLIHYSRKPLGELRSVEQATDDKFKPIGLWVSVEGEDDWLAWCIAEGFGLERLQYATEITIRPDANILHLRSVGDIDRLTKTHGIALLKDRPQKHWVDWQKIAECHQGIIIAPYQWNRRLDGHASWYYPWNCASGCIWDANAVAETRPLPAPQIEVAAE